MNDKLAIEFNNVSKSFRLPHEKSGSLKNSIINFHKTKRGFEQQQVLKNVTFNVKKGEFFGIVGRNGSGKSTILKLLAGIYTPEEGDIKINGRLTPFIELGVGFNPELTGRENIFLNGALLGFSRQEMLSMYEEIVDFAELHRFMDQKLKNYSSGMQVRLAFSIAIRAQNDILLLDEVLAVGDSNFQRKCFETFNEIKNSGRTVIFISHDTGSVKRYCDRAILIDSGKLIYEGKPTDVVDKYNDINIEVAENSISKSRTKNKDTATEQENSKVKISKIEIIDSGQNERNSYKPKEDIEIKVSLKALSKINNPVVRFAGVHAGGGAALFAYSTKLSEKDLGEIKTGENLSVSFCMKNNFQDSEFDIYVSVFDQKEQVLLASNKKPVRLVTLGWSSGIIGSVYPDTKIKVHRQNN